MRELSKEDIRGNRVNNLKQYYVLDYLKKNVNVDSFKIYIDKNDNIKIIDKNNDYLYFYYDKFKKEVIYSDELINKEYELER